jgi:hypothetical protein
MAVVRSVCRAAIAACAVSTGNAMPPGVPSSEQTFGLSQGGRSPESVRSKSWAAARFPVATFLAAGNCSAFRAYADGRFRGPKAESTSSSGRTRADAGAAGRPLCSGGPRGVPAFPHSDPCAWPSRQNPVIAASPLGAMLPQWEGLSLEVITVLLGSGCRSSIGTTAILCALRHLASEYTGHLRGLDAAFF